MRTDMILLAIIKEIRRIILETNVDQTELETLIQILGYDSIDEFIKDTRLL